MRPQARRRARGLSIVELLLVLAIAALMLAPLADLVATTGAATKEASGQVSLEREAGFALERIAAVARASPPGWLDPQEGGGDSSGDWFDVEFALNGGKLHEKQSGPTRVLAQDVTAFHIAAPLQDGQQLVTASLTLARAGQSYSASMAVRLGGVR